MPLFSERAARSSPAFIAAPPEIKPFDRSDRDKAELDTIRVYRRRSDGLPMISLANAVTNHEAKKAALLALRDGDDADDDFVYVERADAYPSGITNRQIHRSSDVDWSDMGHIAPTGTPRTVAGFAALDAQTAGDTPASRYGTSPGEWMPVAVAYADELVEAGFDPQEAWESASSEVVNDSPNPAEALRWRRISDDADW